MNVTNGVSKVENIYLSKYNFYLNYAMKHINVKDDAEDLVHDTFCTALERKDEIGQSRNPEAWILQTLKYKILNYRRYASKRLNINCDYEELKKYIDTQTFSIDEDVGILEYCRANLSKNDFELLLYVIVNKNTFTDASEYFGLSLWACQKRVQRILKSLKNAFQL